MMRAVTLFSFEVHATLCCFKSKVQVFTRPIPSLFRPFQSATRTLRFLCTSLSRRATILGHDFLLGLPLCTALLVLCLLLCSGLWKCVRCTRAETDPANRALLTPVWHRLWKRLCIRQLPAAKPRVGCRAIFWPKMSISAKLTNPNAKHIKDKKSRIT